jgi:transcription initiation factor TFIIA large subunit
MSNPPPIASNYHMDAPPLAPPQPGFSMPILPPMQTMGDNANGPRIKAEPGMENGLSLPSYNANSGKTAKERAAQNLQGMYGSRAAASINAIQSNLPQQGQQQNTQQQQQQQPQQRPSGQQSGQRPPMTQAQYQQMIAEQTARQRAQVQGMGGAQTDGADDAESESIGVMKRFNDQGEEVEMGRVEIDHMIRRKIEAMGRSMEGGGLMLPLKERVPSSRRKKRKITAPEKQSRNLGLQAAMNTQSSSPPQYDGIDDDDNDDDKNNILKEEDDEDAINSDLDDPDEGLNEEEDDDEALGHIMLCMYDKVQRVKNKWYVNLSVRLPEI